MKNSRIAFACDHRGFAVKKEIIDFLKQKGYTVVDCGTNSEAPADYPDYIIAAAEKVGTGDCQKAIGVCYTGIGSAIAANKVAGVRAAPVQGIQEAELSRAHNDANMLILGAGFVAADLLLPIVETWLKTPFEGGRHEQRVNKIRSYEQKHCK